MRCRHLPGLTLLVLTAAMVAAAWGQPAPSDPPAPAAPPEPAPDANISPDAIDLSESERLLMSFVRDRVEQLDEPAFYMLLEKAAALDELDARGFDRLERPAYQRLLRDPASYRAQPVQMRVRVHRIMKLRVHQVGRSRFWAAEEPIWQIDGLHAAAEDPHAEPVVLFSVVDPSEQMGSPDETGPDGRMSYFRGRELDFAALFYKVDQIPTRDGNVRDVPVLLAWDIYAPPVAPSGIGVAALLRWIVIPLALVLLVGAFYLARRRAQEARRRHGRREYQPLRDTAGGAPAARADVDEEQEDEVDPELRRIAEQYRREKDHTEGHEA